MIISDTKKFIFCHIPKNAGRSITKILRPYKTRQWGSHRTFEKLREIMPKEVKEYYKFCVIRNPWDRTVSNYNYAKKHIKNRYKDDISFEWFIDNIIVSQKSSKTLGYDFAGYPSDQMTHIVDKNNNVMEINFFVRYENLINDINKVGKDLNIKFMPLSGQYREKSYREFYNDETQKIVGDRFSRDIEYFKYKF
jgi:chondroitin 4-sulfotransferase 11